jgi:hypothetical protein
MSAYKWYIQSSCNDTSSICAYKNGAVEKIAIVNTIIQTTHVETHTKKSSRPKSCKQKFAGVLCCYTDVATFKNDRSIDHSHQSTPSMTRTTPSTPPPQSASDKGKNVAVRRSPRSLEKEAGVSTRGREQQQGVKKKTKTVVGRKTTGKKKKLVTHKSTKVRPNLGRTGGSKAVGTTASKKKTKPPTPEVEEVIDDDEDDDKEDAEDAEDDDDALEDDDYDASDDDVYAEDYDEEDDNADDPAV